MLFCYYLIICKLIVTELKLRLGCLVELVGFDLGCILLYICCTLFSCVRCFLCLDLL